MKHLSYGEVCWIGDRVTVKVAKGYGEYDNKGNGTVIQVHEGVNRILTVRYDNGTVAHVNWQHIRSPSP